MLSIGKMHITEFILEREDVEGIFIGIKYKRFARNANIALSCIIQKIIRILCV